MYLGRIHSGILRVGDALLALDSDGEKVGDGRVKKIYTRVVSIYWSAPGCTIG